MSVSVDLRTKVSLLTISITLAEHFYAILTFLLRRYTVRACLLN